MIDLFTLWENMFLWKQAGAHVQLYDGPSWSHW